MLKRWLGMVCAALALMTVGCVKEPVFKLDSMRVKGATIQGVELVMMMRVQNDNSFDVKVRDVRVDVVIAERFKLPRIQYNPDTWLGSDATTLLEVPVLIPLLMVWPMVSATAQANVVSYTMTGLVDVTAVRALDIEKNDYEVDESASISRAELIGALIKGGLQPPAGLTLTQGPTDSGRRHSRALLRPRAR